MLTHISSKQQPGCQSSCSSAALGNSSMVTGDQLILQPLLQWLIFAASAGHSMSVPVSSCCTAFCAIAWPGSFPGRAGNRPQSWIEVLKRAALPQVSLNSALCQAERATVSINDVSSHDFYPAPVEQGLGTLLVLSTRNLSVEHLKIWYCITHAQPQSCVSKYVTINKRTRSE